MNLELKDKIVVVTGSSGGIGEQTARAFAAEGAKVVAHYGHNKQAAEALIASLPTKGIALQADITSEEGVALLFAQAVELFGTVHVVVVNAGIFPADDTPIHQMEKARFEEVVKVDLTGAWLTAREFFRVLEKTKPDSASLIFISSTSGVFGEYGHTEYSAAKSALVGLTLSLKNEIVRLVPTGRVNAVAPGWTWTPMTEQFKSNTEAVTRALQTRSLRRVARPADIANQIVTLASDVASGQVSGRVAIVAGGMEGRVIWRPEDIDPTTA